MFWWRKKWLDELSDSDESSLLECRHLLFEEEAGYPICPSCGGLIKENFPKKNTDKARLHLIWKKVQQLWSVKFGEGYSLWLVLFPAIFVPEYLGYWLLSTGDYGFSSFFIASRHTPTMISFTYEGYIPLFIFFMGKERFKRFSTFSLGFERFHKILYSWPVRLVTFIAVICFINIIMPKIYGVEGDVFIGKHIQLTPAQHAKGVELFIFVNMLCNWIVAGLLAIHQLIDRRRTWWLKEANEVYLSGGY
ncbi:MULTISPECIES: hypothetical protein [Streptococcus]|uniref:hypothetical protein n=1 Tax=Streptococcus TaxID=1301 RepID=UPI00228480A6|nr:MULTISPECIES: hypothetical protein [Streptococcus]MCY7024898.1 hypothetical protein [Streptococcus sanguinis]MDQ8693078.1 hypothetical protein [Streptococcus sp. IsoGale022]